MVEKQFGDISSALPVFDDIIGAKSKEQVKSMGEVVSELGFLPDPEKISAIHNMPTPSCKQDLQR